MHTDCPLKDIACMLFAQTKDAIVVCVIGCQITKTRIHTLPKRLASACHNNTMKTVFLPECMVQTDQSVKTKKRMMYSPGGPYIMVTPVVTSWAVAGQRMVFLHMYLQTRVTLKAFPIATPRGRSSKIPWRGTANAEDISGRSITEKKTLSSPVSIFFCCIEWNLLL